MSLALSFKNQRPSVVAVDPSANDLPVFQLSLKPVIHPFPADL